MGARARAAALAYTNGKGADGCTIGNLTSRTDSITAYTERFCYDDLNRLQHYALGGSCTASGYKTVAYDPLGNITSKSDVGSYHYPAAGQAHPHAVTSVTGTVNGVTDPTYSYDANGNMTAGAGRTVTRTCPSLALRAFVAPNAPPERLIRTVYRPIQIYRKSRLFSMTSVLHGWRCYGISAPARTPALEQSEDQTAPCAIHSRSIPDTWVTGYSGDIGNTFGPNGL
jgi:hypothetical protein